MMPDTEPKATRGHDDLSAYTHEISGADVVPADPLDREFLELRLLHPDLKLSFRAACFADLDQETKKSVLATLKDQLGVKPLRRPL